MKLPNDTILARIELSNHKARIDYHYVEVHHHCGEGYIKLPFDLESDIYKIQMRVVEGHAYDVVDLVSIEIPIYNEEDLESLQEKGLNDSTIDQPIENLKTTASGNKANRSTFKVSIDVPPDIQGKIYRISVAVRDQSLFQQHLNSLYQEKKSFEADKYLAGIPIFGIRKTVSSSPIKNPLLFCFNPATMQFDGAKVNAITEQFNLTVLPFYDQKLISFLDYVGNDIEISEREVFVRPEIKSSLKVDSAIIEHLKIYREQKQINRLFKQITLAPKPDSTGVINRRTKPDSYVDVQDYAIRGTTVDLFKEITTNLKFRSAGGGNYKARMLYEFNGITKFYSRSPLFIVNGRATRNGNFIAKLPLQEIGFFSIYSDYVFLERLSPMAHGGVVFVDMVDRNYVLPDEHTLPTLSIQGLQTPIHYPVTPSFKEGSPALSSLLYWDPDLPINEGSLEIEIGKGDISTELLMDAVIYLNSGEAISIRKKISPSL